MTCLEAAAHGCPVVAYGFAYGHVRHNVRAMVRHGLITHAHDSRELTGVLRAAIGRTEVVRLRADDRVPASAAILDLVAADRPAAGAGTRGRRRTVRSTGAAARRAPISPPRWRLARPSPLRRRDLRRAETGEGRLAPPRGGPRRKTVALPGDGRARRSPWRLPPAAITLGALLAIWVVWYPHSPDLAAQAYRTHLFSVDGFTLWDNNWYAGHYLLDYSVLFPPLGALLGLRAVGAIAVTLSTVMFARLASVRFGTRAAAASALFALGAAGDLYIGRLTYALGVTFAVAAVLAVVRRPLSPGRAAVARLWRDESGGRAVPGARGRSRPARQPSPRPRRRARRSGDCPDARTDAAVLRRRV